VFQTDFDIWKVSQSNANARSAVIVNDDYYWLQKELMFEDSQLLTPNNILNKILPNRKFNTLSLNKAHSKGAIYHMDRMHAYKSEKHLNHSISKTFTPQQHAILNKTFSMERNLKLSETFKYTNAIGEQVSQPCSIKGFWIFTMPYLRRKAMNNDEGKINMNFLPEFIEFCRGQGNPFIMQISFVNKEFKRVMIEVLYEFSLKEFQQFLQSEQHLFPLKPSVIFMLDISCDHYYCKLDERTFQPFNLERKCSNIIDGDKEFLRLLSTRNTIIGAIKKSPDFHSLLHSLLKQYKLLIPAEATLEEVVDILEIFFQKLLNARLKKIEEQNTDIAMFTEQLEAIQPNSSSRKDFVLVNIPLESVSKERRVRGGVSRRLSRRNPTKKRVLKTRRKKKKVRNNVRKT
jgi:hypothetical protein